MILVGMKDFYIKKAFFNNYFFCSLRSVFYIILSIILPLLFSLNFYIKGQFFAGSGSTDLLLFFSVTPYFCIFAIPLICFPQSFSVYDDFVPIESFDKILIIFIARLCLFVIQIFLILPAVFLLNLFGSIDYGQLLTCFFCLIFYGACTISICSFVESLFSSKIPFLLVSVLILFVFNCSHLFALYVPLPDFIQSFCKSISFAWHFDAAGKGIFDTRDFIWFTCVSFLFLFLTDFIKNLQKGKCFSVSEKKRVISIVAVCLLVVLNGSRWFQRIDFSKNKTFSVSEFSKSLIKKVNEPLTITYYCSSNLSKLYPQIRDVIDYLVDFAQESKKIRLIIKDPDRNEQTRELLQNYGIKSQQMRTVSSTSTNFISVYSAIVLEYQGNMEIIPFTMEANSLEYDLDIRIKSLLSGYKRTVNIIIGNGMTLSNDYNYVIPWLSSQGFDCNPVFVEDPSFVSILNNCSGPLFVIGDSNINVENAIAIEDYILSGKGNALFTVSPFSVNIEEDWSVTYNSKTNIIEMLEHFGCVFPHKISGDVSCARITMTSDDETESRYINYYLWPNLLSQENASLGATVFWPVPLEISGNAKSYLLSSPLAFNFNADNSSQDNLFETNPFILETINLSEMTKKTNVFGALIEGQISELYNNLTRQDAKIIVISDQYFVNSLMTSYIGGQTGDYRNFEVITNALLKLNGEEQLAQIQGKISKDTSLYKVTDNFDFLKKRNIVFIFIFAVIPAIILLFGVLVNVKNKK